VSHLHWGQEGHEGDDVACKENKKRRQDQPFAKVGREPKAGISCDKLKRYISGLILPSFGSKDRLRLYCFFVRRGLCVMVHYDVTNPTVACTTAGQVVHDEKCVG
jgi:hypothetical protein